MIIALVSDTRLVSVSDLWRLRGALEIQAAQVCAAWLIEEPLAIEVFANDKRLPDGVSPIVCVSDGGDEGTLGAHRFAGDRPAARVYVERSSGLNAGAYAVSEVASHEMCEMIVNPELGAWWPHPTRQGVQVAAEIADPTQDDYTVDYKNTPWKLSNWVTPAYSRADLVDPKALSAFERTMGYGLDWCRRMQAPGEILATGYAVMRSVDARGKVIEHWSEGANGRLSEDSALLARKKHHASRTYRLGGVPK